MPMKTMERKEERLRTSTAIRLPRHPLPNLYFDMGKLCFVVVREAVRGSGWSEVWLLLAAAMESHGRLPPSEPPPLPLMVGAKLPLCNHLLCRWHIHAATSQSVASLPKCYQTTQNRHKQTQTDHAEQCQTLQCNTFTLRLSDTTRSVALRQS